jgi:hypothetical protein
MHWGVVAKHARFGGRNAQAYTQALGGFTQRWRHQPIAPMDIVTPKVCAREIDSAAIPTNRALCTFILHVQ